MIPKELMITEYDYVLSPERIAEYPLSNRDSSKLLIYNQGSCSDDFFYTIGKHLPQRSTLILNNTRVIEARILFQKKTGGVIEIFCLEPYEPSQSEDNLASSSPVQWLCMIGGASKWKKGQVLEKHIQINKKDTSLLARYIGKSDDSFIIEFSWDTQQTFADV